MNSPKIQLSPNISFPLLLCQITTNLGAKKHIYHLLHTSMKFLRVLWSEAVQILFPKWKASCCIWFFLPLGNMHRNWWASLCFGRDIYFIWAYATTTLCWKPEKLPVLNWVRTRKTKFCNWSSQQWKLPCLLNYAIQQCLQCQTGMPLAGSQRQTHCRSLRFGTSLC